MDRDLDLEISTVAMAKEADRDPYLCMERYPDLEILIMAHIEVETRRSRLRDPTVAWTEIQI